MSEFANDFEVIVNDEDNIEDDDNYSDLEILEILGSGRKRGVASGKLDEFNNSGKVIEKLDWASLFNNEKDEKQAQQAFVNVKNGQHKVKYAHIAVKRVTDGPKAGLYLVNLSLVKR